MRYFWRCSLMHIFSNILDRFFWEGGSERGDGARAIIFAIFAFLPKWSLTL